MLIIKNTYNLSYSTEKYRTQENKTSKDRIAKQLKN